MTRSLRPTNPFFAHATELLQCAGPDELEPLAPATRRMRIDTLLDALDLPARAAGYETRLASSERAVDCAIAVFPGEWSLPERALRALRDRYGNDPVWRNCLGFLSQWSGSDRLLAEIPFVCLAFDEEQMRMQAPRPCISVCLDRDHVTRPLGRASSARTAEETAALISTCHELLCARALAPQVSVDLRAVLALRDVEFVHASFMLSRSPADLKLNLRVRVDMLERVLGELGFPARDLLVRELRPFLGTLRRVRLNLVLGAAFHRPLEVELLVASDVVGPCDRDRLVDVLEARGLCLADEANVLRNFRRLRRGRLPTSRAAQCDWYLKLRFGANGLREAKAYLAFFPAIASERVAAQLISPSPASDP